MIEYGIKIDLVDGVTDMVKGIIGEFKGLGNVVGTTRSKVDELRKASSDIKSYQQLQQQLSKVNKSIKTQREYIANLNRELTESDGLSAAQMKRKKAQIDKASVALEKLENKQSDYNHQLKETGSNLHRVGVNTDNLSGEQRRLNQEIQKTTQDLAKQNQEIKKTTQNLAKQKQRWSIFSRVGKDLQGIRNEMTGMVSSVAGVIGMGMSLKATLEPALDFEVAMDKVQSLTRLDLGQSIQLALFNDLEKQALSLGRSTAFSATQVADAQGFLAMAGFEAKAITSAIPGILDLSKAAGLELATTADIGSNILSGFRLGADQMNRVGDVMAAAFSRSNVDLRMLGESMKYAAPIAAELKIGLEETAAMAGLLGNVGIQGSDAGTALRALYTRMASPPSEAKKSLKALGIQTQEANGDMRSLAAILGELAEKTEKMGDATRLGHFNAIAGMEAGAAMATLVAEQGAQGISKFVEILKGSEGESSRIAKIMGDNTQGLITGLTSRVEGLAISVGKVLKPVIDPLIKDISDLVTELTDWVDANPELVDSIAKVALGVGALVGGIIGLGIVAGWAKIAFTGLGVLIALVTSPLVLLVAGLALLGGAWYFWEDIMDWLEGSFPEIHDFFVFDMPEMIDTSIAALERILPFGGLIGDMFRLITAEGFSWKESFGQIMDWFGDKVSWLKQTLESLGLNLTHDTTRFNVDISEFAGINTQTISRASNEGKKPESPKKEGGGFWSNLFGGGRAKGGSVTSGKFYEVNEIGPELLNMGGKTFLMPNASGTVIPLQQPAQTIPSMRAAQAQQQSQQRPVQSSGRIDIHIDSPVPTRVKRMESEGMEISVNTGPMGVFNA